VLCRSMENLGLGASREFNHLIQWNAIILKGPKNLNGGRSIPR
jgi:hypothetical protein